MITERRIKNRKWKVVEIILAEDYRPWNVKNGFSYHRWYEKHEPKNWEIHGGWSTVNHASAQLTNRPFTHI